MQQIGEYQEKQLIFFVAVYLTRLLEYTIMPVGKRYEQSRWTKAKPQQCQLLEFLLSFRLSLRGLVIFVISIQPFGKIVANYSCPNGNQKRYEHFQMNTPFLLPDWERQHANYIIWSSNITILNMYFGVKKRINPLSGKKNP